MVQARRVEDAAPVEIPPGYELVDGVLYMYEGPCGSRKTPPACEEVDGFWYPYEEGAPVVHGTEHFWQLQRWLDMVRGLLAGWPKAGIYSDIYVYHEPRQVKKYAPDLYILPEVREVQGRRKSVLLWEEPSPMVFVMELLSDKTEKNDLTDKFRAYQNRYRVPEYLICDPRPEKPTVKGYRLKNGKYVPIAPDARGRIWSEQLSGWFGVDESGQAQIWNAADEPVPVYSKAMEALTQATIEAEASRRWAEEQAARAGEERARANEERQRADEERQRADEERQRRESLEARLRELEEKLSQRGE